LDFVHALAAVLLRRHPISTPFPYTTLFRSLPVRPEMTGRIHPISQVIDEITEIFAGMGFDIAEGPDIDDDFHNFTALNIPPEHRSEEHTSELQSRENLVCRLLLEKKKKQAP